MLVVPDPFPFPHARSFLHDSVPRRRLACEGKVHAPEATAPENRTDLPATPAMKGTSRDGENPLTPSRVRRVSGITMTRFLVTEPGTEKEPSWG
jgi:hypothetical protein